MQIDNARKNAKRYLSDNLCESRAKRPPADARVMVRYPKRGGMMITASDVDTLQEKLARKIQQRAKGVTRH